MRISQLAERSGVPATTLRFYETAGLLRPDRSPSGYRLYGEDAVERLAFIRAAKNLGLRLEEVSELLAVWESGACADVKADLRPRIAARVADARARAAELAAFIAGLQNALEHLDELPDRTGPCDHECGFPGERWRSAPVACSLEGDALGERTAQWRHLVGDAASRGIEDGVRLTVPADRATGIMALATAEQKCCPFFDFRLHLDGSVLHLEVRAPREGAGMLAELFGSAPGGDQSEA
jgi:DNA-binding transcriptional MerR regulator